jgi:hypothetical protein
VVALIVSSPHAADLARGVKDVRGEATLEERATGLEAGHPGAHDRHARAGRDRPLILVEEARTIAAWGRAAMHLRRFFKGGASFV